MRRLELTVGLAVAAGLVSGPSPGTGPEDASPRVRLTMNDGWRFAPGPMRGAEAAAFDDSRWEPVTLPHTWNAEDAFTEPLAYRRGAGWYRKRLTLDPALRGRRIFLYFEGANQTTDLYLNARHAGRHVGGYTAFVFDVTDLARFDSANVIAVRVDNSPDPDVPPLNADFTFYGGIYRDVWLVVTDPVHLEMLDHASPGVFVDSPGLTDTAARVRVRGTVVNATPERKRVEVVSRVLDANGAEVSTLRSEVELPARGRASFRQLGSPIVRPRLWSPADPYRYRVTTDIRESGRVADRVHNPLGFRRFELDAGRGLTLNGRPLRLTGTNRHQDRAGYGNALPDWAHVEDVRLVKETGFNFLRLAHYPQDPAVLDAADRLGLVVWEEIPIVNLISTSDAFAGHAERMLVEMIRQHYNHPSVFFWGYMNEVMLRRPDPVPPGYTERIVELARRLEARVKAEDSTRATVTAISLDEVDNGSGLQDIPDALGLNLYFGWYYRDLAGFGPYLDSLHRRDPRRPLIVSEYGADSDERIHAAEPRAFDFSTEQQQRFHEAHLPQILKRSYLLGSAVWNQFDFGSKGRHDSKPNLNQKGLLYFDRTPKDVWHYYRAALRQEPVLHIASRDWRGRAGSRPEDRVQPVLVYSNLGQVELLLNGRSQGKRQVSNYAARWAIPLTSGSNRLLARGVHGGAAVEDAVTVRYTDRTPFFTDAASTTSTMAVNVGSHYQYIDAGGTAWEADRPYRRGSWGYQGGREVLNHHRILGTPDDALFQAARDGASGYRFDVPDGVYRVSVALAELEHDRAGQRVFSVRVNDRRAFAGVDLAGEYGRYVAVERAVVVEATGGHGVVVRLEARVGSPVVSGIRLDRL
ncbi:MAG: glycoside hydrolase family 2 TIM barrel-domain containing protein [Gemmatimonadales bacterium]